MRLDCRSCRLSFIGLLLATVTACVNLEGGSISGSQMDISAYRNKRIAVLPIAINENYQVGDLPVAKIRESVLKALSDRSFFGDNVFLLPLNIDFPLTPTTIYKSVADVEDIDAAVGISILSWERPIPGHHAKIVVSIAFVDRLHPGKRWMFAKVWRADAFDKIPDEMDESLFAGLTDVGRWLGGRGTLFRTRSGPPNSPLMIADSISPRPSLDSGLKQSVDSKYLHLVVSSFDDSGIENISVTNEAEKYGFDYQGLPDESGEKPIFLQSKVSVPLRFGDNLLRISASNKITSASQNVNVSSTAKPDMVLFSVGGSTDSDLSTIDPSSVAAEEVYGAGAAINKNRRALLRGRGMSWFSLFELRSLIQGDIGVDDEVVLYVSAKLLLRDGRIVVLLEPPNEGNRKQSPTEVNLADFDYLTNRGRSVGIFDFCADEESLSEIRRIIPKELSTERRSSFVSVQSCNGHVGSLAAVTAKWLSARSMELLRPPSRISATFGSIFGSATSVEALAKALSVYPDILLAGGSLPHPLVNDEPLANSGTTEASADSHLQYYLVTEASERSSDAIAASKQWNNPGSSCEIIKSNNGTFAVSVGHYPDLLSAKRQLEALKEAGKVPKDSFVLPPERWSETITSNCNQ